MPHDGDGTSAACPKPLGIAMEPVYNASGPIVCKRVSGLLTRRVAEVLAATLTAAST
jgi:hypothetical protein